MATHKSLFEKKSEYQDIFLARHQLAGLVLYLDGHIQFAEFDEYRYHEGLGVVPLLYCKPASVLVCGGGDGLLADRLLAFGEVQRIVLVDLDGEVIRMAQTVPEMLALNHGSLLSEKVEIVNGDAYAYLMECEEKFDLIISDLPDPHFQVLNRLYSKEFYRRCHECLTESGLMAIQSCYSHDMFGSIYATLASVFPHVKPYKVHSRSFEVSGFNLASKQPFARVREVPSWTRYLNEEIASAIFAFSKPEIKMVREGKVNTDNNNLIIASSYLYSVLAEHSYRYADDTVLINTEAFVKKIAGPQQLEKFITIVSSAYNVIFYVPEDHGALQRELIRFGFSSQGVLTQFLVDFRDQAYVENLYRQLEKFSLGKLFGKAVMLTCKPVEHEGLRTLVEQYLADHEEMFRDGFGSRDRILTDEAEYYYYENLQGKPIAFSKIIHEKAGREAEIAYGCGSARQHIGMFLHVLTEESKKGYSELEILVPYEPVVSILRKLGHEPANRFLVFTCSRQS